MPFVQTIQQSHYDMPEAIECPEFISGHQAGQFCTMLKVNGDIPKLSLSPVKPDRSTIRRDRCNGEQRSSHSSLVPDGFYRVSIWGE